MRLGGERGPELYSGIAFPAVLNRTTHVGPGGKLPHFLLAARIVGPGRMKNDVVFHV